MNRQVILLEDLIDVFRQELGHILEDVDSPGPGRSPVYQANGMFLCWLFIYHGVDFERIYRLGVMVLDKDHPERVLYRSEEPILEPEEDYERFGNVPNVVFSCGNVLLDGQLLIYYGCADSVLCVATFDLGELTP